MKLDDFDKKIISELQKNGRLSNIEVAERVNLSHSSCSRRIAKLEKNRIITGYRALTDRKKLGLSVRAFCGVVRDPDASWKNLSANLAELENVVSVFAVSGDIDLILDIVAEDMEQYSNVVLNDVLNTKGVKATRSSFVLDEVKSLY
jgi:Lrp/AsnC family transcriptional regulator, leucine-responsive regulatory protein